ncbi:hypothetical protein KHQ81_07875 [Mycoplasmatota bacterium]|nr:hypothetical protein KHQ81_07875 [Mycoplasmatota bacterium]
MSNNLTVFADSTINGGSYDKVRVFGSANVLGDLTAQSMKVYGAVEYKGKCKIEDLKLYGACEFFEYVEVENLNIKGACEFNNDVKVNYLKIYGAVEFNKNVFRCKEVKVYGEATVSNLEADEIYINGLVECTEQLNGEKIEITTNHGSTIKEMVGTHILVKPQKKKPFSFFKNIVIVSNNSGGHNTSKKVEIETIEGDDIYLENVVSKAVRGNKITIGPNCEIDLVEYHETYNIIGKDGVKEVVKY